MANDAVILDIEAANKRILLLDGKLQELARKLTAEGGVTPEERSVLAQIEEKIAEARSRIESMNGASGGEGETGAQEADANPPVAPLTGPVGAGGKNAEGDVQSVQQLLNDHGASLEPDGLIGPKTIGAITKFQQSNLGFADGRVDPGGKTWGALTGGGGAGGGTGGETEGGTGGGDVGGGAFEKIGGGGGDSGADGGGDGFEPFGGFSGNGGGADSDSDDGSGGLTELIDKTPKQDRKFTFVDEEESEDDEDADTDDDSAEDDADAGGGSETTFTSDLIDVKIETDASGKITNVKPLLKFIDEEVVAPLPPFVYSAGIKAGIEAPGGPVKKRTVSLGFRIMTSGAVGVGLGSGFKFPGTETGVRIEYIKGEGELEGYEELGAKALIDLDNPGDYTIDLGLPIKISLKGELKVGFQFAAEIGGKEKGVSKMWPVKTYEDLLWAEIRPGPKLFVGAGAGADQFSMDVTEYVKKNPTATGTGPTGEVPGVTPPKKVESHMAEKAAKDLIATLRGYEQAMEAAYAAGWANPNLVGKANALTQQDEAKAKQVYGQAWTQRALAKQSYDQYASPPDSASAEIIAVRATQANTIAGKFQTAISLFQQGDTSW